MDHTPEGFPPDELTNQLGEWVAKGLISQDQADRITSHETKGPVEELGEPSEHVALLEVLGYLGGSLVGAAGAVTIAQRWSDLGDGAKVLLLGFATLCVSFAGWLAHRRGGVALKRLTAYLWFLGAVGVGGTVGVASAELAHTVAASTVTCAGLSALVYGLIVWRITEKSLQQVGVYGAVLVAGGGLAALTYVEPSFGGLAAWGLGWLWVSLGSTKAVLPSRTAQAIGAGSMLYGAQMFASTPYRWPLVLGLLTAAMLLALSIEESSALFLGFGSAAVFIFVPQSVIRVFGDTIGAPIALLMAGLALLACAALIAWMQPRLRQRKKETLDTDTSPGLPSGRFPETEMRTGLHRRSVVLARGAVGISAAILVVGVFGRVAPPDYAELSDAPDSSIPGRIAYFEVRTNDWCVSVVEASGAASRRRLKCQDGWMDSMKWTPEHQLEVVVSDEDGTEATLFDVEKAKVIWSKPATPSKGPPMPRDEGIRLTKDGRDAIVSLVASSKVSKRGKEIARVKSPMEYKFYEASLSPDKCWVGVVDSRQNLLLVASDGHPALRKLVGHVNSFVWEPLETEGDLPSCK